MKNKESLQKEIEYNYMLQTAVISEDEKFGIGFNGFKYPLEKGAKIIATNFTTEPTKTNEICGIIHDTKKHYIVDKPLWIILKYEKGTEIIINDEKIKVPYAWIEAWGTPQEIQPLFEKLTGKKYNYSYAIQINKENKTTQLAEQNSIQLTGDNSTQTATTRSIQVAGLCSTQTAGDNSTQIAGIRKNSNAIGFYGTQTAGDNSTQISGASNTQIAGFYSVQLSGAGSNQIAMDQSIQFAGEYSTQTAGNGSISIINGKVGYCCHKGRVLHVFVYYDPDKKKFIFLSKVISDTKKHKLEVVKKSNGWILKDTIIE